MSDVSELTWEEFVEQPDLHVGYIEVVEGGIVHRLRIDRIWIDGDVVRVESYWCAWKGLDGPWQQCRQPILTSIPRGRRLSMGEDGRINVESSPGGPGYHTIFPWRHPALHGFGPHMIL